VSYEPYMRGNKIVIPASPCAVSDRYMVKDCRPCPVCIRNLWWMPREGDWIWDEGDGTPHTADRCAHVAAIVQRAREAALAEAARICDSAGRTERQNKRVHPETLAAAIRALSVRDPALVTVERGLLEVLFSALVTMHAEKHPGAPGDCQLCGGSFRVVHAALDHKP